MDNSKHKPPGFLRNVLIAARPRAWTFFALAAITALGTLNRESFVFCITGMAVHLWSRRVRGNNRRALLGDALRVAGLLFVFAAVFAAVRYHFGLSRYQGGLWMFKGNIANLQAFLTPNDALYMGAGALFAYATTLVLGNREYLPFIAGYAIPMLLVAFFISRYSEHRIFYPLIVFLIASIVRFLTKREIAPGGR